MFKQLLENSNTLNNFFTDYINRKEIFQNENPDLIIISPKLTFFNFVYGAPNERSYLNEYFEGVDNIEFFHVMNEIQTFAHNELNQKELIEFNRILGDYANVGFSFGMNYQFKLKSNLFNILNLIDQNINI